MNARETIAEAVRRGIEIRIVEGAIVCHPPEKVDAELDEAFRFNAGEIALLLTRGPNKGRLKPIIKIVGAGEVRSALAEIVFRKMGIRTTDPFYYVNWMTCSPNGDVRVEIHANTEPAEESWK